RVLFRLVEHGELANALAVLPVRAQAALYGVLARQRRERHREAAVEGDDARPAIRGNRRRADLDVLYGYAATEHSSAGPLQDVVVIRGDGYVKSEGLRPHD